MDGFFNACLRAVPRIGAVDFQDIVRMLFMHLGKCVYEHGLILEKDESPHADNRLCPCRERRVRRVDIFLRNRIQYDDRASSNVLRKEIPCVGRLENAARGAAEKEPDHDRIQSACISCLRIDADADDNRNAGPAAGGKRAVNGLSRERDKNIRLFPHHEIMQVRAPCERFCGSSLPFFGRQKSYMNSADGRVQFIFVRIGPFGCHDDFIAVLCELSRQIGDNALGSAVGQAVQMKCYLHNTRFSRISVSVSVSACRYRSGVYVSARSFAASP